ncbi:MAG: orotidine-5'-phosphate decarboxylase [Candidatus Eremiobacteraeota bacterium]|nr:orotidine-5'-phosphate decarboxylase [Candidatus Eremiobacteraeota bacterium]
MTQLIIALDEAKLEEAADVFRHTAADVQWYKVGYQAYYSFGNEILAELREARRNIFLDLKLHDIPNTVAGAIRSIARSGASFVTVHAAGGRAMMTAAAKARDDINARGLSLKVVAVTMLTSLSDEDLREIAIDRPASELVSIRAALAQECGLDGVVCPVEDVPIVRARTSPGFTVICPGIRPEGDVGGDQKRTATPTQAVLCGADFIVVGRPITKAADPRSAVQKICAELAAAEALKPQAPNPI